jgi:hypothetical protein
MKTVKQLIFPFLFLCATSVVSAYSLFMKKPVGAKVAAQITSETLAKKSRAPAAVAEPKTLIFDCDLKNQDSKISATVVSIQFKNCGTKKKSNVQLMNTTNQYMAQIFHPSDEIIATDFIQLAKGENILKFEISLNDKQKKTQIIKIDRVTSEIQ